VLSAGGLSVSEFKREITETIEVVRRGESEKEVIIPLRGRQAADDSSKAEAPKKVYKIDDPPAPPAAKSTGESKPDSHGPLPLA